MRNLRANRTRASQKSPEWEATRAQLCAYLERAPRGSLTRMSQRLGMKTNALAEYLSPHGPEPRLGLGLAFIRMASAISRCDPLESDHGAH